MQLKDVKTVDELLEMIPAHESNEWELKGSDVLNGKNDVVIKALAKPVSAFANTGGGNLVIGILENQTTRDRVVQSIEKKVGRQTRVDWLSTIIHTSVSFPLQTFVIHEISIPSDDDHAVYVVQIGDSPAAPHQAKTDPPQYYWRPFGKSEPAPHFHLDLLRNRISRVPVEIDHIEFEVAALSFHEFTQSKDWGGGRMKSHIRLTIDVLVHNTSDCFTQAWGILFASDSNRSHWRNVRSGKPISYGGSESGHVQHLLPHGQDIATLTIESTIYTDVDDDEDIYRHNAQIVGELEDLFLTITPASHNVTGEPVDWGRGTFADFHDDIICEIIDVLRSHGHDVKPEE